MNLEFTTPKFYLGRRRCVENFGPLTNIDHFSNLSHQLRVKTKTKTVKNSFQIVVVSRFSTLLIVVEKTEKKDAKKAKDEAARARARD